MKRWSPRDPFATHCRALSGKFPPKLSGKNVTARPNVYYGESDILNAEEVQRLRELGKVESIGQSRFRLTMPHPAKGQMYALVWDPPPDAEVTVS